LKKHGYSVLIFILIAAGLLSSLFISFNRHKIERANKSVDMICEYEEILLLAGMSGKPVEEVMRLFRESGATSLSIYESTLETLEKRGFFATVAGPEALARQNGQAGGEAYWERLVPGGGIKPDELYFYAPAGQDFQEIEEDLKERFGPDRLRVLKKDGPRVLALKADYEAVKEQSLSMLSSDLKKIRENGFSAVVRPSNYQPPSLRGITHTFSRIDKSGVRVAGVLFGGQETLGYPDLLPATAQEIKRRGWTLGMTEHPLQLQFDKQAGLTELAELVGYQAARLYVIEKKEQEKALDVPRAVRRWALTDEERNVRMNLIRFFWVPSPGKSILDTNLEYVALIRDQVLARGFSLGPAGIFEPRFPDRPLFIPIIFGAAAAGVLYLSMLTELLSKRRQIIFSLLAGGLLSLLFFAAPLAARQATAFFSAVIFPVLAMAWQMGNWGKGAALKNHSLPALLAVTFAQLTATVLLSLIGGLYISGILGDIRFFLEMDIYRGVKLTFLLPLFLITLVYLKRYTVLGEEIENKTGLVSQLKQLLDYPVQIKTLALLGLGLLVAYIFIARTGHTSGIGVPAVEVKIRLLLEEIMYARPREKEFLVGHPAFFLAAFAAWRGLPHIIYYCLIVGATIGQGCLVETFAHMRTPIAMSVIRAFDGLLLGGAVGIAALLAAAALFFLGRLLLGRYAGET
jgi:hypothetical protein